jgi:hypothetical protein
MSDSEQEIGDYIEPTPAARRMVVLAFVGFFIILYTTHKWLLPAFLAYLNRLPICQGRWWMCVVLLSLCAILPVLAILLASLGVRILRHGQVPVPGAKVFRRTKIVRGRMARLRAYALILTSAMLVPVSWYLTTNLIEMTIFKPIQKCPTEFSFFSPDAPWAASIPASVRNQVDKR